MADFAVSDSAPVQAQLDRLSLLSSGGDSLGLDRITRLLDRLGRPQDAVPPVFHVAGTNGKGSTCAMLRAGIEASGRSAHVFTSPHLVRFNERIRIAGQLIGDAALASLLSEVLDAADGIEPSFFEVTTAVAFLAFARTPADACIVEVGLGGRLDSTNVVDRPAACGIASIGIDHQQFLGDTLAQIASEKAGIARLGVPLVCLAQPPEAEAAIIATAKAAAADLRLEGRDWSADPTLVPSLGGAHQLRNANLAWQMLAAQDAVPVSRAEFGRALARVRWPARLQRLADGPLTSGRATWIDGAHNVDAARALASHVAGLGPMHLVLGVLANKDADGIVAALAPHARSLTFVGVAGHAHHDPAVLAERHGGRAARSLTDALNDLPEPRLVAGSLYLAGEALALNGERLD